LRNDDVVQLVKGGFKEETVVGIIKRSSTAFQTSTLDLIHLREQGVSDLIITSIVDSRNAHARKFAQIGDLSRQQIR
jgi:hypothetical protein